MECCGHTNCLCIPIDRNVRKDCFWNNSFVNLTQQPVVLCNFQSPTSDCSEIFIQRPTSLTARSQTYSNYKSRNTVKFLIAISPTGAIIFVSKCWGGRASDKHITSHSGFLNKLIHGDLVLADRGFDITEALACYGANLAIPPFTKGKPQLSCREVETARELSRVRIHVERAIGRVKNYKLLQATLPITLVKNPCDQGYCVIDKILFVCCALCNLQPPLVS